MKNILSIFIDESGDFGEFSAKSPYYMPDITFLAMFLTALKF